MPYQIFQEDNGVYIQHIGISSDADKLGIVRELKNNYHSKKLRYMLSDYLGCEGVSFSPSLANELADLSTGDLWNDDTFKVAIVANDLPDLLAMTSSYMQSRMPSFEVRLFSEINEARDWCEN